MLASLKEKERKGGGREGRREEEKEEEKEEGEERKSLSDPEII